MYTGLLNVIIMIPPSSFLWILMTSFNVEQVVHLQLFLLGRREHGADGETNGLHRQCGTPVFSEDYLANVTITNLEQIDKV